MLYERLSTQTLGSTYRCSSHLGNTHEDEQRGKMARELRDVPGCHFHTNTPTTHTLMRHYRASSLRNPAVSPPPQQPHESLPQTRRSCGSSVQRGARSPGGTPQRRSEPRPGRVSRRNAGPRRLPAAPRFGSSSAGTGDQSPPLPRPLPFPLPAGRLTDEDAQMLEAGERVLAGVQHLLRGLPHIPVRLLGEHPVGPGPGAALQRRAAASGSARTGALHSRRRRRLLLLLLPPPAGRSAAGRGGAEPTPRGPGGGPGLDSPLPPSLVLLPLLHDSRQVRPQASLWQPRRDVTAALPGAPPGRGGRRPRLCGKRGGAACRGFWQGVPGGGGEWKPCSSNWGEALPFSSLKVQYKVI